MSWRVALLLLVSFGAVMAAAMLKPIPQDPAYHAFVDQRGFAGIPNFLNVVSNLPILIAGLLGWHRIRVNPELVIAANRPAWLVFFGGIALTALGSAWFHWQPGNSTLIWDRLPMTIAFMSLFSIILAEYFAPAIGRRLLLPLLLAGAASVAWWAFTESRGAGDLRPYALVQFLPMLLILLIITLYRSCSDLTHHVWWLVGIYAAAKIAEHFDAGLFALGGLASGHTLKHLLVALAPVSLLLALNARRGRQPAAGEN